MIRKGGENLIYLLIWLVVLMSIVFTTDARETFNWPKVILEWIHLLPFLGIFLINNYILVPKLLFKKKIVYYLVSLIVIIIVLVLLSANQRFFHEILLPDRIHRFRPPNPFGKMLFGKVVISFLVVGFNTAVKLVFQRQKEELENEERDKAYLQNELSFLRQQISPHFFMNTLNNIHALIDIDTSKAREAVVKLSTLMRYLLTDIKRETSTIKDEFEFLLSYIDLMKLRYSSKVKVIVDLYFDDQDKKIPCLLFISLIENAFKYGISYSKPSFVSISSKVKDNYLYFEVKNSKVVENDSKSGTGVGLTNIKKQLVLLYESDYSFNIIEDDSVYHVKLKIPLSND